MMRQTVAIACMSMAFASVSTIAHAKLNKQNKAEIQGYVNELKTSKEAQVLSPTLLTWGHVSDRKSIKDIQSYKTHSDANVRLSAGLALIVARDRKASAFVVDQLKASNSLYLSLRDFVALLDDKNELKLIDALLKKAKPETQSATFRYLAEQDGDHFKRLINVITSKDDKARVAAVQAIIASGNPEVKKHIGGLLKNKKKEVKQAALELGLQLAKRDAAHRVDTVKLLEAAMGEKDPTLVQRASLELTKLNSLKGLNKLLDLAIAQTDEAKRILLLDVALEAARGGLKPDKAKAKQLIKLAKGDAAKIASYRLALLAGDLKMMNKAVGMLSSNTYKDRLQAVQILGYSNSEQAAKLIALTLFEGNRLMRLYSAQSLRILAKDVSLDALSKSLQQEGDKLIKAEVIRAIGALKSKRAFNILQFQATSSDKVVKLALLDALKSLGNKSGYRIVEIMLRDRDNEIKWQAFVAGLHLAPKKAMQYKSTVFRSPPATFLTDLDGLEQQTKKDLFGYLSTHEDSSTRGMAIAYMLKRAHDKDFATMLRDQLKSAKANIGVRRVILDHYARHMSADDQAAVEVVARDAKNPVVSRHAALILAKKANKSMEATFRGLTSSDDAVVKAFSVYGLTTLLK